MTYKKLMNFSEEILWHFKTTLHLFRNIWKTLSMENTSRFWFKRVGNFLISENIHFLVIFRYLQISFAEKYFGVDQVLTKILQIYQKLTFNVFHILNQCRISKIEKNIWWDRPPKKRSFFWGGSGALDEKDFGYVSGRKTYPLKIRQDFDS